MTSSTSLLVRIWKSVRHSSPGCSFARTLRVVFYFPLKHSCLCNKEVYFHGRGMNARFFREQCKKRKAKETLSKVNNSPYFRSLGLRFRVSMTCSLYFCTVEMLRAGQKIMAEWSLSLPSQGCA